jgi:hypothetical protein
MKSQQGNWNLEYISVISVSRGRVSIRGSPTKRCRLSWLTNSAPQIRVHMRGRGGVAGSQPMSTAVHITLHGAQINFGYLPPYLTYGVYQGRSIMRQAIFHGFLVARESWSTLPAIVQNTEIKGYSNNLMGLQRDVVYLGWPIAPSYMSLNAGGGGESWGFSQWQSVGCTQEPK